MAIIFKDEQVEFKPKETLLPQEDFGQEESKAEPEFDMFLDCANWCLRYLNASKLAGITLDQDLKDIQERKAELEGVVNRLGKH